MLRCPICGSYVNPIYLENNAEKKVEILDGKETIKYKCRDCDSFMSPIELKHDYQYYYDKAEEIYDSCWRDELAILDEVKEYGMFDGYKYKQARSKRSEELREEMMCKQKNTYSPKCPTCGSTSIQKISATSKIVGASLFGLFSKTAKSQFKCNNCGYKW